MRPQGDRQSVRKAAHEAPLQIGIIGCGVIAPTHAEGYGECAGIRLRWACDLVESKAKAFAERFGVPRVTADYRTVLADPELDAVSICTDHASHAEIAVAAIEAGKHVLCEKALAATTAGLDRMLAAHRARPDRVFAGVLQHRFDRLYRLLHDLVREGDFGTPLTANLQVQCLRTPAYYRADCWRGTWAEEGGSVMINQAIHFVDILDWIMGGAAAIAGAFSNRTHAGAIETEDTAVAALRFRDGALGTIAATSSSNLHWEPSFYVYGSAGSIDIRNGSVQRIALKDAARQAEVEARFLDTREPRQLPSGKTYYGAGHAELILDFVAAIREGRPPRIPAVEARRAVDLVLALYRSHREQRWVALG